jgi:hypothetical protein
MQCNAKDAIPNKQARRLVLLLRRDGLTLEAIACELNYNEYLTRRGKKFCKTTVLRLLKFTAASVSQGTSLT